MDALKKLKEEMQRKRAELAQANEAKIGQLSFVKQKDVIEQQERKRLEKQEEYENAKRIKMSAADESEIKKSNGLELVNEIHAVADSLTINEAGEVVSADETKSKLRALGVPATMFGESDTDRMDRLMDTIKKDNMDDLTNDNDDNATELVSNKAVKEESSDDEEHTQLTSSATSHSSSITSSSSKAKWYLDTSIIYNKIGGYSKEKVVLKYFKSVLKRWGYELQHRPDSIRLSAAGRLETQSQLRCKEYLKAFFRMCVNHTVPDTILPNIYAMVKCCEEHDFVGAHDYYLKTAIGNSAWPIGLTMVMIVLNIEYIVLLNIILCIGWYS